MNYYEVKIKYCRPNSNGKLFSTVTELYLVQASSFGEAEAKAIEEVKQYALDNMSIDVVAMRIVFYNEINKTSTGAGKYYYRVKITITTIGDDMKEKKMSHDLLVHEDTIEAATGTTSRMMNGYNVNSWSIDTVQETKILDVLFAYNVQAFPATA